MQSVLRHRPVQGLAQSSCRHPKPQASCPKVFPRHSLGAASFSSELVLATRDLGPWRSVLELKVWRLSRSFRKLGVPYFGVLIIRILLFTVLYSGPLFSETPKWGFGVSGLWTGRRCLDQSPEPESSKLTLSPKPIKLHARSGLSAAKTCFADGKRAFKPSKKKHKPLSP